MPDFGITKAAALSRVKTLTPREAEIAEAFAMGERRSKIAERLNISMRTLDLHVGNIRSKLALGKSVNGLARIWFAAKIGD